MILEKNWNNGDICTIKMTTGDEVVAKITDSAPSWIIIAKPLVLSLGIDPQTQQYQLQMLPTFLFSAKPDAKLKIDMQHVITITLSEENAKNSYITNTTGLAVNVVSPLNRLYILLKLANEYTGRHYIILQTIMLGSVVRRVPQHLLWTSTSLCNFIFSLI